MFSFTDVVGPGIKKCVYFADTGTSNYCNTSNQTTSNNDTSNNAVTNAPLTLEQLGKFTAISLKWPLLINDLENYPNLLVRLEHYSRNHTRQSWQSEPLQPRKN